MNANIGWESGTSNVKLAAVRRAVAGAALDLGCGRGWYAAALAGRGFVVTGMDQANRVEDVRVRVIEKIGSVYAPQVAGDIHWAGERAL